MYGLYLRLGLIYRESQVDSKKSFSIHYFFVDDKNRVYLTHSLARLQKILRVTSSVEEVARQLSRAGEKSIQLQKYAISDVKTMVNDGVLPFTNRTYVEIKDKETGKELKLFSLVEDDIHELLAILRDVRKQKADRINYFMDNKLKESRVLSDLFNLYQDLEPKLKMKEEELSKISVEGEEKQIAELNDNLHYLGHFREGKPDGQGKQVLVQEGISFNGNFKAGRKHGIGYLVNSNLDTLYCEFVNDELSGI